MLAHFPIYIEILFAPNQTETGELPEARVAAEFGNWGQIETPVVCGLQ